MAETIQFQPHQALGRAELARIVSRLKQRRFWIVQGLLVVVTALHGVVEYGESIGLAGFFAGIEHLPVMLYVLPIVLAAYWYGIEGGLMTGLLAMVLSIPNLFLWHQDGFAWLGEAVANLLILTLGLFVGVMAERTLRARALADEKETRLGALHHISAVLTRHDDPRQVVEAVLAVLTEVPGFEATVFTPEETNLTEGSVAAGDPDLIGELLEMDHLDADLPIAAGWSKAIRSEVTTIESSFGYLVAACSSGGSSTSEENAALLHHLAHELAAALENTAMRRRESDDLRRYAQNVTTALEQERIRIARDLHDGVAQPLIVLQRGLSRLDGESGDEMSAQRTIVELRDVARETLESVRRTTRALRPALLDDLGLLPALESLADRRRDDQLGVEVRLIGKPRRLSSDLEIAAFRIAQEALNNVSNHSGATSARLAVEFGPDYFILAVEDNGSGFERNAQHDGRDHLGLLGMRERAALVGGELNAFSRRGNGTTIKFTVPVTEDGEPLIGLGQ